LHRGYTNAAIALTVVPAAVEAAAAVTVETAPVVVAAAAVTLTSGTNLAGLISADRVIRAAPRVPIRS
jgi:hypothetical protein